jgi:hypothetical protein
MGIETKDVKETILKGKRLDMPDMFFDESSESEATVAERQANAGLARRKLEFSFPLG